MLTFDATALARAAASSRGVAYLVEVSFLSGLMRVTNYPTDLTSTDANTWLRQGNALTVSRIGESEDTDTSELVFTAAVADSALLAKAIGNATEYRGRSIKLYFQLLDNEGRPAGAQVKRWSGYMTRTAIERPQPSGVEKSNVGGGKIKIFASRAGLARLRRNEGLRLTDAQQQKRFPGDLGYQYIPALIEKPVQWLSKAFQELR